MRTARTIAVMRAAGREKGAAEAVAAIQPRHDPSHNE
jgi:hypothetical protein